MGSENDVLAASRSFYDALNGVVNGDASAMKDIWSDSAGATTMHPIGGRETGPDPIRQSFEQFAGIATDGEVRLEDQIVHVAGELAYELGVERGAFKLAGRPVKLESRVTNVYRSENGAWKIVHHHSDLSQAVVDLLDSLTP